MQTLVKYAIDLRRELHQCPEIGFDLPQTLSIVRRELDKLGIEYTDKYGQSSIVATINPEKDHFTIGLRGDMDALPIQEPEGRSYGSKNPGCMHACGHDVHTANLLAVTKKLWEMKDEIRCRIKILFTPAEEYIEPGCRQMVANGVMDDIDCAITTHVSSTYPVGTVAIADVSTNANSTGFTVEFHGKPAHVAAQQRGVDAIRMAVEAYQAMETMAAKELRAISPRVLNIGVFQAGKTNNIICDYCKLYGSIRAWEDEVSEYIMKRVQEICQGIAQIHGGHADVTVNKFLPFVQQHPVMVEKARATMTKLLGEDKIIPHQRTLGGEDFGFLSRKKPCALITLGTKGENPDTHNALHNDHFDVDEECFKVSIPMFIQFVLDNQDGIEF